MASCVNTHNFRVRICDAPETLIVRFVLSSRYLSERQTIRLLKKPAVCPCEWRYHRSYLNYLTVTSLIFSLSFRASRIENVTIYQ